MLTANGAVRNGVEFWCTDVAESVCLARSDE